jgi:ribosome maturation factor RimP
MVIFMEKTLLEKVETIAKSCAEKLHMEIISVDYVKEFGARILRIIAAKEPYMTIDDSSDLNRLISDELDRVDLIQEQYYLEVASEGLEKELKTDQDMEKALGKYICIKTYEKIEGKKEIYGDLIRYDSNVVVINADFKGISREMDIERSKINMMHMAVKF